ncbi:MAG: hypothetical protein MJZ43_04635 [Bacteroidaceae bacterium]|nr:hypothetical protein [Candidatus Equimonas faecalis]MCQ2206045.1 hypothetical protein [Bacteroidaceae bacterium]
MTTLNHTPWADAYPLKPEVSVRISRNATCLLLHYAVKEPAVRATAEADNGNVWEDSCAECFIKAPESERYYNIECNCAGTMLIGCGTGRNDRQRLQPELLSQVRRTATLGRTPFGLRQEPTAWELTLEVPFALMPELHDDGLRTDYVGNIYKCGDLLPQPHFVTLFPIQAPQPDYHRPEFFQPLPFTGA